MKEQLFGLKKEPINRMLQKMESEFLHEKIKVEYELNSLVEKNNQLRNQLKEIPCKSSIVYEDTALWNLGKKRISNITMHLQQQKEMEMDNLRINSAERIKAINLQINEIESEIQSTEQILKKMLEQIVTMVEHSDEVDKNNIPIEQKTDVFQIEKPEEHDEADNKPFLENRVFRASVGEESLKVPDKPIASSTSEEVDLLEQIDSIKSRYIVGKEAGEDLLDSKGGLIISKSQVITPQVVKIAHREGKLAELIVNMKISGLGED